MRDDPPAELVHRIADAVEAIERTVTDLRDLQHLTREAYRAEENRLRRDAVERKFETLTAATLDAGKTILKLESRSVPDRRKAVFDELETIDVIDPDLATRLRESVAFRDVLAHSYGPIVNDDIVYDALQHSLARYVEFVECVDSYLSDS